MSEFPITNPPVVDFANSYSQLRALSTQRDYLRSVARDIMSASVDISRFDSEGARYANYATAWAVTLFFADLLRNSICALDRRAPILFRAIDNHIATANKYLKLFGRKSITTKDDVLKAVDANLQGVVKLTRNVKVVRDELKKQKVSVPKEANLLLDIGVSFAQDSIIILQAGQVAQHSKDSAASAQANLRASLARVYQRMMAIDAEISRLIERGEKYSNTA
jgi:hypothetical protein